MGLHSSVGGDLVNHCVNDIAVQGATPLFFLDYFASGKLDPEVTETVVSGLADACRANGCALIGGETAQMPGFYAEGEYDLAGFIVGAVDRDKLVTGADIKAGDVLVGFPSTGLHTNGYSLARKLMFDVAKYKPSQYVTAIKEKAGAALMKTHRSYLHVTQKLVAAGMTAGMAHITGGGITENLPRILPKGLAAQVELGSWPVLPIFDHLRDLGQVSQDEMMRTFNMGVGLIAVIPAAKFTRAKTLLDRAEEKFYVIGRIIKGDHHVHYTLSLSHSLAIKSAHRPMGCPRSATFQTWEITDLEWPIQSSRREETKIAQGETLGHVSQPRSPRPVGPHESDFKTIRGFRIYQPAK